MLANLRIRSCQSPLQPRPTTQFSSSFVRALTLFTWQNTTQRASFQPVQQLSSDHASWPRRIFAPGSAPAGGLDAVRAVLGPAHDPYHPSAVTGTTFAHPTQSHEHARGAERLRLIGHLVANPHVVIDLIPAEPASSPSRERAAPPQPAADVRTRCLDVAVHHPVSPVRELCVVDADDHKNDPAAGSEAAAQEEAQDAHLQVGGLREVRGGPRAVHPPRRWQ
ncbi:hypothetical protein F443_07237, partial [Phytophthora nicotianae P1569]